MSTAHLYLGGGTKWYSHAADVFTALTDPGFAVSGCAAFSTAGAYLVTGSGGSNIFIFKRTADALSKLTVNAPDLTTTSFPTVAAFSRDDTYLAVGCSSTSPYLHIYKRSGDQFFKLALPDVPPTSAVQGVRFSPDGNLLVVTTASSPYLYIYTRAGDAFAQTSNPATVPAASTKSVFFSPDGVYMALLSGTSIFVYKWNGSAYAHLSTLAGGVSTTVIGAFSADTNYLSVAGVGSPYVATFKRTGDSFSALGNPDVLPTGSANSVAWSNDSVHLYVGHANSPYITIYRRSADTFAKLANPASLPGAAVTGIAVNPPANTVNAFGPLSGITRDENDDPAAMTVRSHLKSTGNPVETITSDPTTGEYQLSAYSLSEHYIVIFHPTENAQILDHMIPIA